MDLIEEEDRLFPFCEVLPCFMENSHNIFLFREDS
jgi:hypothetical protein